MNLIICLTPLQTLIAQHIIRQHPRTPFTLLMLCYHEADNAKYHHYFQQTAALCQQAHYVVIPAGRWARAWRLPALRARLAKQYVGVFVASIDNIHVHYLLSHLDFDHCETFDDGSGNLIPSGILYRNQTPDWPRRLLNRYYRIRLNTEDLRQLSHRHHTLYPTLPNIAQPTEAVCLWPDALSAVPQHQHQRRRLLLGQPVLDSDADNIALSQRIIAAFAIEHYFPHPREAYRVDGVQYIDSTLIFEDYLLQALAAEPNTGFEIYHLASTAALNVYRLPNVRVYAVRPNLPLFQQAGYARLYEVINQLGLPVYPLPKPAGAER